MTHTLDSIRADFGAAPAGASASADDYFDGVDWDSMVPPEDPYGAPPADAVTQPVVSAAPAGPTTAVGQYLADRRPVVLITRDDAAAITRAAVTALSSATRGGQPYVYRQVNDQGEPERIVTTEPNGAPKAWPESEAAELLYSILQPAKSGQVMPDGSFFGEYAAGFPVQMAKAVYRSALHATSIPAVRTIATAPVLLADGTVASEPGYNTEAQVLINIPHAAAAQWARYSVPAAPTQADAQAAIDYLNLELLGDFPWESDADRATAFCYLLTCASRHLYGATPFFAMDATEPGTGKGYFARIGFIISQGHEGFTAIDYQKKDDAEIEKRLLATALEGGTHVHSDETPDKVTSLKLTALATTAVMKVRILGTNTSATVERLITTFCGNNLTLGGDMMRRVLKMRLVWRGTTKAAQRGGWRHSDILGWAKDNRPEILSALHTVLAYALQNGVKSGAALGSYEQWTQVVLAALTPVMFQPGGRSIADLAMDGQRALATEEDDGAREWGELLAHIDGLIKGEEQRKGIAKAWLSMGSIYDMVHAVAGATPPDFPDVLNVAAGIPSVTGRKKAWSGHFAKMRERPMEWGGRAFKILTMKDKNNRNVFRVEEIPGWQ